MVVFPASASFQTARQSAFLSNSRFINPKKAQASQYTLLAKIPSVKVIEILCWVQACSEVWI